MAVRLGVIRDWWTGHTMVRWVGSGSGRDTAIIGLSRGKTRSECVSWLLTISQGRHASGSDGGIRRYYSTRIGVAHSRNSPWLQAAIIEVRGGHSVENFGHCSPPRSQPHPSDEACQLQGGPRVDSVVLVPRSFPACCTLEFPSTRAQLIIRKIFATFVE